MCCTVVRTRVWGEKSGSTTHIWYCCYCGDGPIGLWIPSCPLCGHKRCGGTILHNELAPTVSLGPQYSRNLIAAPTTISEIGAVHDPKRSSLSQDFKASFSSLPGNGKKRTSVPDANKTSNSIDRSFNSGHYTPLSNILPDEEDELMKRGDSADDEEPSDPECEYGTPQGSEFSPVGYTGIELLIRKRANHLACRISNLLQFIIDPEAGIIRCTSGTRAGSSTPKAGGGCSTKKASSVQHSKWGAKPSQRRKATTERESDQDDEQEERRLFKKRKIPVETNIPRLACIFWKRKRQKCRHRSCAGPGWSTIHHLRLVYAILSLCCS
ncbi:hypothetical protein CC78DRAFT_268171 [Lojkania enalia]|uniref:Uncharacterized protein n=1 Tax=Lojkania enalia TaxID=147567 RepID=A0A9P4K7U3_9PLEO|nr:hypothetical protein CC78DRAFT_268171 [Didymosphaeria enalia]